MPHPDMTPFLCACGHRFVERKRLEMHVNTKNKTGSPHCSCGITLETQSDLESHMQALGHAALHTDQTDRNTTAPPPMRKPKHKCDYCPEERLFRSTHDLQSHLRARHADNPAARDHEVEHPCPLCAKIGLGSPESLLMHIREKHRVSERERNRRSQNAEAAPKRYICGICGRRFGEELDLREHDNIKHNGREQQIGRAAETEAIPLSADGRSRSIVFEDSDGPSDDEMDGGVSLFDPQVSSQTHG